MDKKRIYLSPISYYFDPSFKLASRVLEYSETQDDINDFEYKLQTYLDTNKPCLALNSGTSALHIALILSGVSRGDYVLCQSHTFVACANAILYQGAIPVFIDSEKETWNMSPSYLKEAIDDLRSKNIYPKALIAASLYGMPFKFDAIYALAKANNIIVIEDSAEALGSTYNNKKCGTLGDYGILSFNYNKIISSGGGGLLICKTKEDYSKALKISTQAKENKPYYHHQEIGYNYRMGHFNAKVGISQIEILEHNIQCKKDLNNWYQSIFNTIDGVEIHNEKTISSVSNKWLTTILIDPSKTRGITREHFILNLEKYNIESRPLWKPMHLQPLFKEALYYGTTICEDLFNNGLCLPSGSKLNFDEKTRIEKAIFTTFK